MLLPRLLLGDLKIMWMQYNTINITIDRYLTLLFWVVPPPVPTSEWHNELFKGLFKSIFTKKI